MSFKAKYPITPSYLPTNSKRRSGQLIGPAVKFIVAHDTGNPGSTAANNVSYFSRTCNDDYASAHLFVDDKEIIECVPALTANSEKAWHVRYNVTGDNELYGYEANDAAIGVEYCYGSNINADESYKRYIWVMAFICYKFNLNPSGAIIGHFILDPARRSDPKTGLAASGRTYEQLLSDISREFGECVENPPNNNGIIINQPNKIMKIIKNPSSQKIYAVGNDNKKHWIFNEETFNTGREMGLWGNWDSIEMVGDDGYAEGHAIILIK